MAASRLRVYSSSDAGAPALPGTVGSLLTVLNAVLVNGYGTQPAAGWSKPFADAANIGCYKNGTGSTGLNLVVNDAGYNATPGAREALACGWETLAGIASPVGSGGGQFPTPAQFGTVGAVAWHKSTTADATARPWIILADAHTFYMWVFHNGANYTHWGFGDLFSVKSTTDAYRCFIRGDTVNTSTPSATTAKTDVIAIGDGSLYGIQQGHAGHYIARTWGGGGSSVASNVSADGMNSLLTVGMTGLGYQRGITNIGADNALYFYPLRWNDGSAQRGRLRGLYVSPHNPDMFVEGQVIAGGGDYAGKEFMIIKNGVNGGVWFVEISETVETN